jgi:hypothetical protein
MACIATLSTQQEVFTMNKADKPKTIADIQLDQFLRELDTDEGRKRIGDEAYREAKAAEKRQSLHPKPTQK